MSVGELDAFGLPLMYLLLPNVRGGLDLALAMFSCIDLDDGDRLRSALENVNMPISGLNRLTVGFDEDLPEPSFAKVGPDCIWVGIDKHRFTSRPDLKSRGRQSRVTVTMRTRSGLTRCSRQL